MFNVAADSGNMFLGSYRDPHLRETNEIFEKITDYLENFEADDREMSKAIIGTFGRIDAPLTPRQAGERSFSAYMARKTYEEIMERRAEALNCTPEDIRRSAALVRAVLDTGNICVIGASEAVEECRDLFKNVEALL